MTLTLPPSTTLAASLAESKPTNAHEAHEIMDAEFERRAPEARAKLAQAMKGWSLGRDDLAMFVRPNWGLGYQQVFRK